ncbi:MAG: hypothetical protein E6417_30375, partial [Bradyrhizobium sp.]|nr:hypothetical protein [Bradyrhizobium sp.]
MALHQARSCQRQNPADDVIPIVTADDLAVNEKQSESMHERPQKQSRNRQLGSGQPGCEAYLHDLV